MTTLEALILGLTQGLTEFLPISSSGHLVLLQKLLHVNEGALTFDVAVHFATLIAVCIVFRKDIWEIIRKPWGKLPLLVLAGTIPTVLIGFVFKDLFESLFESGATLGLEFILTGVILWYAEGVRSKNKGLESTTYLDAAVVGVAQAVAILPAVSRSGLTLAGALARGLNREFALRFSFLMSIPAILGPALLDGYKLAKGNGMGIELLPVTVGMVAAAVSGYLAIRFMLKIFAKTSLKVFSYYVFILGGLVLVDQLFFGRFFLKLF